MSWNVSFIGKPAAVARALKVESGELTGQSKIEYDAALPHLLGLVENNFCKPGHGNEQLIRLNASGHGNAVGGDQVSRNCAAAVEPFYGNLVT